MRRSLLALAAGGTLLVGSLGAGSALAQDGADETGPDTAACVEARAALSAALVDLDLDVGLDAGLDVISDAVAQLDDSAGTSAALSAVAGVRIACAVPDEDDDQDDDTTPPPPTTVPPAPDEPTPGDPCSTDEVPVGIVGTTGECIGAAGDPTTVNPAPGSTSGPSAGGQVTTVPRGHADTGGGPA